MRDEFGRMLLELRAVGICPCQDTAESELWFARVLVGYLHPATASFRPASAVQLAASSKTV